MTRARSDRSPGRRIARRVLAATAGIVFLAATGRAGAQDIEAVAALRGIPLPQAYFDEIARDPNAFELPPSGWSRRGGAVRSSPAGAPALVGSLPLIVIPALFADSEAPFISSADVDETLFGGSLEENLTGFYLEASGGRMSVVGTVAPWVRTSLTMAETVGTSDGLGGDSRTGEYLVEALQLTDPNVDFRQFDNDGPDGIPDSGDDDGLVDAVAFEFLEVGASCGGPAIWPHRSSIRGRTGSRYDSQDIGFDGTPIQVSGYIIQGVTECDGVTLQAPNVIAHELGHTFGLPDLYHPIDSREPEGRRWVVGCWGLMAAGSWGCGDPTEKTPAYGPIHMSPWSRDRLGWVEYETVGDVVDQVYYLDPGIASERALRVPLRSDTDEVLVLEYRPQVGFDRELPAGGVLAYRENPGGSRRPARGSGTPYTVHLLEADGRADLLRTFPNGGNRGEVSDAFALDGAVDALSNLTLPSLHLTSGGASTVQVHEIAIEGGMARIRLTTRSTPTLIGSSGPMMADVVSPFRREIRVAGGALPYRVSLTEGVLPAGLEVDVDGERVVLEGTPLESGSFPVSILLRDILEETLTIPLTLQFDAVVIAVQDIVDALFGGGTGLDPSAADYIDFDGNGNGRLDVGDLRRRIFPTGG